MVAALEKTWLFPTLQTALTTVMPLYLQAGLLGCQVGASSHCSQLYGRHGAADVQVFTSWPRSLHLCDTVGAAHRLSRVLTGWRASIRC